MDDAARFWLVNARRARPAISDPIQYGRSWSPHGEGFDTPYPAPGIGDMQGGLPRVRLPANNLNHFTSTTGPEIVRSDRYPADLNGDLLFADPVGRFIRRARIVKTDGLTQVRNAYPGAEFIISTDPLFRPVNIKQGPDGAIYILDMYTASSRTRLDRPRHLLRYKIEAVRGWTRSSATADLALRTTACRRHTGRLGRRASRRFPRRVEQDLARMNDETPARRRAPLEPIGCGGILRSVSSS